VLFLAGMDGPRDRMTERFQENHILCNLSLVAKMPLRHFAWTLADALSLPERLLATAASDPHISAIALSSNGRG
jgi:hypothetical protein